MEENKKIWYVSYEDTDNIIYNIYRVYECVKLQFPDFKILISILEALFESRNKPVKIHGIYEIDRYTCHLSEEEEFMLDEITDEVMAEADEFILNHPTIYFDNQKEASMQAKKICFNNFYILYRMATNALKEMGFLKIYDKIGDNDFLTIIGHIKQFKDRLIGKWCYSRLLN